MKELKAKEGMYLTQTKDTEDRIFVTAIKGKNVNPDDWRDATLEEKEQWEKVMEEKLEKEYQ